MATPFALAITSVGIFPLTVLRQFSRTFQRKDEERTLHTNEAIKNSSGTVALFANVCRFEKAHGLSILPVKGKVKLKQVGYLRRV
jgi:hypothetical protein